MKIEKSPKCRQKGESKSKCVSRKIKEILDENPGMKRDQAIAIAESICSKSCSTKFLSREEIIEFADRDYLMINEISKCAVRSVRPDLLYRTHSKLHLEAKMDSISKKLIRAHQIVSNELISRGFQHNIWDSLDTFTKKKKT